MAGFKLSSKGQTTIPKSVRDHLGLEPGDRLIFIIREGEVILQPLKVPSLLDLRGSVKPRRRPEGFDEVRRKVRRQVARRVTRD